MELLIIFLLIVLNGVFAMAEIAVVSARKTRLQNLAERGDKQAKIALGLIEDPNRFLSTTQIGITLIGVMAGAFGGATVAEDLAARLNEIEAIAPYSDAIAVALIVLLTTYLSLVIGELVPKRLALRNPEGVTMLVAAPMRRLSVFAAPIVHILSWSTEAVLFLIGVRHDTPEVLTDEDIHALLRQGARDGSFEDTEHQMVVGVLQMDDFSVDTIMTPWTEIEWLDLEDSLEENLHKIADSDSTKFPVCVGRLDNVLGILHVRDLLNTQLKNQPIDLRKLLKKPRFVPNSQRISKTLEIFKQSGQHLALVIDEHGSVEGLVTLHDVLVQIVGDVDPEEPSIVERPDGGWVMDGLVPLHEVQEKLRVEDLPDYDYQTLGGFVMGSLGRIPTVGDQFEWKNFRFEVLKMDEKRVATVVIVPI